MMKRLLAIFLLLLPATAFAQSNAAALAAKRWRQQHERPILDEFSALLTIPNVAAAREDIQHNATTIAALMQRRGIATRLLTVPGANPIVFGELTTPGAVRTLGFYAHYDGQPLDPKEWTTPPFQPVLRSGPLQAGGHEIALPIAGAALDPEARLYARSAGDDKAPIEAMLTALDAIRAAGMKMQSNIKFAFEGEEEANSINFEKILVANRALFAADVWLVCDGPVFQNRQQAIAFGARGIVTLDLTVYGPRIELHSGNYGNWAPNPALSLAQLLASMKDDQGHVMIDHFYDDVASLNASEKQAIADTPKIDHEMMRDLWLGTTESSQSLAEAFTAPSLNIRGLASSRIGDQASNVIPSSAVATLDIRLVKGMDKDRTVARFIEHVKGRGFFVVDSEPSPDVRMSHAKVARISVRPGGYNAVRTPMDLPIAQEVIRTVESARGPTVKIPNLGGSLPLDMFERALGTETIVVPIANHDDNQHSFDENLRIQNLWDGIELMAALLTM